MRVIGIDPGVDGAMALWDRGQVRAVMDLPVEGGEIDGWALWSQLCLLNAQEPITMVFLEETNAMPKIGSKGNYSQGLSRGIIVTAVKIAAVPLTRVKPAVWKRKAGLGTDKADSLKLAKELWPDLNGMFARVKDHNRAEAGLIARFGAYTLIHQEAAS